jgi:tripartite-type tricarboxylate transporter receptor subunit TctC
MTGIKMTHVPYRGTTPALTDLLAGQVQMVFCTIPSAVHHIKSGALRALAVTSATRLETIPDLPTVAETVPGFDSEQWYGVGVPTGAPAAVIATLNREVNAALTDPNMKARIDQLGGVPLVMSPDEFGKFVAGQTEKMAKVIKAAGISVK